ncbi:unnamed protein product, partial [Prunus brigantina]
QLKILPCGLAKQSPSWIVFPVQDVHDVHYNMYLPGTWILGCGYSDMDTWICRKPGTLGGVGVVCAHRTCHRHTSIEDSDVRAGEPSPPLGRLVPSHMVVEDSSMCQTIPRLDCFPLVH